MRRRTEGTAAHSECHCDVNPSERIYLDALPSRSSNPIAKARSSVLI